MKWFKLMNDLPHDPLFADLLAQHGHEGYGFVLRVFQLVSGQWDPEKDPIPTLTYPTKVWARTLGIHTNNLTKFMGILGGLGEGYGGVSVGFDAGMCRVQIPRLLNLLDDYTRKSVQTTDKVPLIRTEEIRLDKKRTEEKNARASAPTTPLSSPPQTSLFPSEDATPTPATQAPTPDDVAHAWNEAAKPLGLPCVRLPLAPSRVEICKARLKEPAWAESWQEALTKLAGMKPYFLGRTEEGFKAHFDWFIGKKLGSVARLVEGSIAAPKPAVNSMAGSAPEGGYTNDAF